MGRLFGSNYLVKSTLPRPITSLYLILADRGRHRAEASSAGHLRGARRRSREPRVRGVASRLRALLSLVRGEPARCQPDIAGDKEGDEEGEEVIRGINRSLNRRLNRSQNPQQHEPARIIGAPSREQRVLLQRLRSLHRRRMGRRSVPPLTRVPISAEAEPRT